MGTDGGVWRERWCLLGPAEAQDALRDLDIYRGYDDRHPQLQRLLEELHKQQQQHAAHAAGGSP